MTLKFRLILMQFLQFFIWGSWLLTISAYWFQTKHWSGSEFGAIFSTMGIASLFMPAIAGMIADRFINAEKLYAFFHFMGAITLFYITQVKDPSSMFWAMLINMCFYMPTISLSISVSYTAMKKSNMDVIKDFPPIRIWGTIGFIAALWTTSLSGLETSIGQFYIASVVSLLLALYALSMPACPPLGKTQTGSFSQRLGLDAFALFKDFNMALFFIFAMLLGAALQLTNAYGDTFLHDFALIAEYKNTFAVKHPAVILSISQFSETAFILTIPFFLRHFGIKHVMFMSMLAWALRFGLLAFGNPGDGLWMIVLSCIVYGMAFDFFNISGSLYVETQVDKKMRASAQGLFMMMVNGFGALLGSRISGIIIDKYFLIGDKFDWRGIWLCFAAYAALIAVCFIVLFKKPASSMPLTHELTNP
ncbi:MAG: nucleoside permease [Myxococcales bacterium]|nr:nucleoside permease [Myxococcales bacterium]USN50071.1 MAG: nucleoside permease [Myxococcales bacterium]